MNDRLKNIIFKKLYEDLSNVEIIPINNSIWFIDREKKHWYFEYGKSGILWWRYDFFKNFFNLFSLEKKWELYTKSNLNIEINGTPLELKHMGTPFYPKALPQRAISLMWNQRSVDTFLGLPFNIASYGLLLEIIAKEVNMVPDELIGNLGDVHLYSNHIEQAKEQIGKKYTSEERTEMLKESMGYENYHNAVNELMPFGGGMSEYYEIYKIPYHTRRPYSLPTLNIKLHFNNKPSFTPEHWLTDDFVIENYQSHPSIKAPLSN